MNDFEYIWIFMGARGWTPAGVFSDYDKAVAWIAEHRLSGYLGKFPVDISVFDWAVQNGFYVPKEARDKDSTAIARFGTAALKHEHYYDGHRGVRDESDE